MFNRVYSPSNEVRYEETECVFVIGYIENTTFCSQG